MRARKTKASDRASRLRGARKRAGESDKQSDLFAHAEASAASDGTPAENEASGGRPHDLAPELMLTDDERILGAILEEDEAAERKRREAHEARLEREREQMSARRMRDGVRRDQIDIALDPDDGGL